jgi:hypothetical protein
MKKLYLLLFTSVLLLLFAVACPQLQKLNGSIAGTIFDQGRPGMMGQIMVVNPRTLASVKIEPVKNSGHFIIPDVPPGEYLLQFLGPTAMPLGEYKYVKVQPGRPITNLEFEIREKDPKVQELLDKIAAEKAEGTTTPAPASGTGK